MTRISEKRKPTHWLFQVASEASGKEFQVPAIEPGTCRESMWAQAAELSGLSEIELVKQAAEHFQVGLADFNQFGTQAIRLVPEKVARTYHVFPLHQDDRQLVIATSDPGDIEAEETLRFVSGRRVVFELAPPSGLRRAIEANYQSDMAIETVLNNIVSAFEVFEDRPIWRDLPRLFLEALAKKFKSVVQACSSGCLFYFNTHTVDMSCGGKFGTLSRT